MSFTIPKQKLTDVTGRKLLYGKVRDGFENKTWAEYFAYLIDKSDITLTHSTSDALEEGTKHLFGMWMKNFAENIPYIRQKNSHSVSELGVEITEATPEHSAVVVGRGPSIWKHKHLEMLAEAKNKGYNGLVVASDGMLIECLKNNITPDLTVSVDGSPLIRKWYDHKLVHGQKVALPVTINNEAYKTCEEHGCQIYWFMPMFDLHVAKESITKVLRAMTVTEQFPDGLPMLTLGGNSGTAAWVFACFILKCSPVALIGIDFGYPEGTPLQDTPYYSNMVNVKLEIPYRYKEVYHPTFKTKAYIDDVFSHYKQAFLDLQYNVEPWYIRAGGTINASEGGTLFGRGVKCISFKEYLEKYQR